MSLSDVELEGAFVDLEMRLRLVHEYLKYFI